MSEAWRKDTWSTNHHRLVVDLTRSTRLECVCQDRKASAAGVCPDRVRLSVFVVFFPLSCGLQSRLLLLSQTLLPEAPDGTDQMPFQRSHRRAPTPAFRTSSSEVGTCLI